MAKQFQLTNDIIVENNSYINSDLRVPAGTYFEVTTCYPKGYITYSINFWQEVDGQRLEGDWNRKVVATEEGNMASRQAALQRLFNDLVPELKNHTKIN